MIRFLPYIIGAAVIAAVWYHGNHHGKQSVHLEYQEKAIEYQEAMSVVADELDKAQKEKTIEVKTKVKTIYVEADPTGCADARPIDGVLNALRPDPH